MPTQGTSVSTDTFVPSVMPVQLNSDSASTVFTVSAGGGSAAVISGASPAANSTFDITIRYTGDPQYQAAFTAAAARWSQIITADIADMAVTSGNRTQYNLPATIDDLYIDASIVPIDGAGQILGEAGPVLVRSGSDLPYYGQMEFDSADVASMFANGTWTNVILHEMGHVLGIGTLWDALHLKNAAGDFIGAHALAAYRTLVGNASVTSVPVEHGGGSGTAGAHWSEAVFDNELMTGYAEAPGVPMPISTVTVGSLQDIGYTVNYAAADSYALPGHTTTTTPTTSTTPTPPTAPTTSVTTVTIGTHPAGYQVAGIGDFNADGTSDVLWFNPTTNATDIWGLNNGQWARSTSLGAHPAGYQVAGVGDFNHNGTSDVLWFNPTNNATDIWSVNNGQWAGSTSLGAHPAGYQVAGVGDFNHDGTSDVLWFNPTTNATDIWSVNNGQWAGSTSLGAHPAGYRVAGIGDFNHDGTSDVLWFNPANNATDIWLVNNGQWAGSTSLGAHPAGYQVAGIGDFNHDGTSDVAWYNAATHDVDVWLVAGGRWSGSLALGAGPTGATPAGVGDFNHDGVSDILWRDTTTGQLSAWLTPFT